MYELALASNTPLAQIASAANYENAYFAADELLKEGLITKEKIFDKIREIHHELIVSLNKIPSIEDITDEIEMYNYEIMDQAVDIIYRFRRDEYDSDFSASSFETAETEKEEDIRAQIAEVIWGCHTGALSEDEIFEALSFNHLTFVISHKDALYRNNAALAMDDSIDVLANDCQEILFPQFTFAWGINSDQALIHARVIKNQERMKMLC